MSSSVLVANAIVYHYWPSVLAAVSIWFFICYFFHTKMIRLMSHGHPVTREEEPELYNLLENLCISRGLSVPKLEIIETRARNAFASGINQKTYTITVTRGLLHTLTKDELEAVLAHELTHIMNKDVRLLIISIIFTGMLGFASQMAWNSLRYPRYRGSRNKNNAVIIIAAIAVVLWLGYIATIITRFALSRRREYLADAGAIMLTKNPEAMMRALIRISGKDQIPHVSDDIALMCIENSKSFLGLFSTHPSIDGRLKAISNTTSTQIPSIDKGKRANNHERFLNPEDDSHPPWLSRVRKSKNPWIVTDAKM
jgi:heat shock protein HtpX